MPGSQLHVTLVVTLVVHVASSGRGADLGERCAQAISGVRSYDVTFALDHVYYPNPANQDESDLPVTTVTTNNRDVLAFGLGRRVEGFVGTDEHHIEIIDWESAGRRGRLSAHIANAPAGHGYLDFINPNCEGIFLADLLRNERSSIQMLDGTSSPKGLPGLVVEHPDVRRPIRVWMDPDRGNMPSVIEVDMVDEEGQSRLYSRTRMTEFRRVDDAIWVPVKGVYEFIGGAEPNSGDGYSGTSLVVDTEQSSWNSIGSGELFSAASLPEVNRVTGDGHKGRYGPQLLSALQEADRSWRDDMAKLRSKGTMGTKEAGVSRWLLSAGGVLVLLVLFWGIRRGSRMRDETRVYSSGFNGRGPGEGE